MCFKILEQGDRSVILLQYVRGRSAWFCMYINHNHIATYLDTYVAIASYHYSALHPDNYNY